MLSLKFHSWNWTCDSWEQDFFTSRQCVFSMSLLSPLSRSACPFIWTNSNFLPQLHIKMFLTTLVEIWRMVLEGFSMYFYHLAFISICSRKKACFFIVRIWIIYRLPRMLCAKFDWKWISVSAEWYFWT